MRWACVFMAGAMAVGGCGAEGRGGWPSVISCCGVELVRIPPGTRVIGTVNSRSAYYEQPTVSYRLDHVIYMSRTEITAEQWRRVVPARDSGGVMSSKVGFDDREPVTGSWEALRVFCRRFEEAIERETSGRWECRYPTEAEWEYAARFGRPAGEDWWPEASESRGTASSPDSLLDNEWFGANSGGHPHPVAQKRPSRLGLYDMLGNVAEACEGWYTGSVASMVRGDQRSRPKSCPVFPGRAMRGGDYMASEDDCRPSRRAGRLECGIRLVVLPKGGAMTARRVEVRQPSGQRISPEEIRTLIGRLDSAKAAVRRDAVHRLGCVGPAARSAVPKLVGLLEDPNAAEGAARSLGLIGDRRALPHLLRLLAHDHYSKAAAVALGYLGAQEAIDPLLRMANAHPDDLPVAFALGMLGDKRAGPALLRGLGMVPHKQVMIKAIGQVGFRKAIPELQKILGDTTRENPYSRLAAAVSLARLGNRSGVPQLLHAMRDPWWQVRRAAALSLADLGDPSTVAPLKAFSRDKNESVRWAVLVSLCQLGDKAARAALERMARDVHSRDRFDAMLALRCIELAEREPTP